MFIRSQFDFNSSIIDAIIVIYSIDTHALIRAQRSKSTLLTNDEYRIMCHFLSRIEVHFKKLKLSLYSGCGVAAKTTYMMPSLMSVECQAAPAGHCSRAIEHLICEL